MASKNGRSSASVSITFGLLTIPCKLYLSAREEKVSFNMVTSDGNPVKQKLVDSVTGEEVNRAETQKGYKHLDKYVVFTKDEIAALDAVKNNVVAIEEFVPTSTIDPLHVEKSYHADVDPKSGADKTFQALVMALAKKKRSAVAKWYSRGKEHLVTITPRDGGLVFNQMFYATEVRSFEPNCAKMDVSDEEIELLGELIDDETVKKFGNAKNNPELYRDSYVDRVNKAVQQKLDGGEVTTEKLAAAPVGGDLMSMLRKQKKSKKKAS